jgi:hypothetical protein
MSSLLQSAYLSVLEVKTRDELESELARFTQQLEFQTFAAMAVIDHFVGESEFINVDNTPASYRDTFNERHGGRKDPVMQHCKTKNLPIILGSIHLCKRGPA